jgi:hypothetical protein
MPYANPVVLYTFDSDGTNSGSGGATYNITNGTTTIIPTEKLKGTGSVSVPVSTPNGAGVPIMTYNTGTTGVTISFWIKFSSATLGNRFLYTSKVASDSGTTGSINIMNALYIDNTYTVRYYAKGTFNAIMTGANYYTDNLWHHMVVVYNGGATDNAGKIYVDNNLKSSNTVINIGNNINQKIWIGGCFYGANADYGAGGNIDDFRIYNYVADATFVDYLYKLGSNTSVASLSSVAIADLVAAGASVSQLVDTGKPINDIINAGYSIDALIKGGVSITTLITSGVSIDTLLANNVTISQLLAAGVPFSQLVNYVKWLDSSATSNLFNKTYVNSFIDLSGDMWIRNDGALISSGDVSFNYITVAGSTTFSGDTTLKSKLFIGNDISVNGNLYVGGDLSVNGTFSGNFASGIIPTTAIIDYQSSGSSNVEITGNVRVAGDASFNGTKVELSTNTILKVSGNVTFTDGTTLSTYDDNVLSGSFAAGDVIFRDSTFQQVTCHGVARTTTKTTSSDYRLKTNVTDLDGSYTVDKLVPIQYDNILSNKHEFGLIAHELQEVYPELVKGEKDGVEYQRVNYNGLIGVLVKEVQELNRRKEALCKK